VKTSLAAGAVGALVLGGASVAGVAVARRRTAAPERLPAPDGAAGAARALHGSAALLASSVLADSAMEHYRGDFENPGMFAPLISSTLALLAGAGGALAAAPGGGAFRTGAYRLATAVGVTGLGFHLYNIGRRPGGFGWLNLFYGAPVGAPAALSLSGILGLVAQELVGSRRPQERRWRVGVGQALAGLNAFALAGTVGEAALFHFRGAFQNPLMWAPVTLPTVAAALMTRTALEPPATAHPLTRLWLTSTLFLGFVGMGLHAYGVSRAMGGWRNWSQNLIDGPPLPAPPSFSALALAGLAALSLIEQNAQAPHVSP
jgi:hypothetical protein